MASNVELLKQAFAGLGKGNAAGFAQLMDEDSELVLPDSIPYGGTYRGPEAAADFLARDIWRWFDEFTSTPTRVIDAGDQIVVPVRVQATAKNGRTMDVENVWIYEFSDGRLRRGRVYADTAVINQTVEGMEPAP
jgi:ketosteroid isomerase-like protein